MRRLAMTVCLAPAACAPPAATPAPPMAAPLVRTVSVPGTATELDLVWIDEGGFWIGRREVTWNEYLAFCSWDEPLPPGVDAASRPSKPLPVEPYDHGFGLGDQPALGVSWNGARSYCRWLTESLGEPFRLPREHEWSVIAAAAVVERHAWHAGNSGGRPHAAGAREPDPNGLYDVLGNLWEYADEPLSGQEPGRAVLRGGSYRSPPEALGPGSRLPFDWDLVLDDPNFPPGRWWVPDGEELGFRVLSTAPRDAWRDDG